MAELMTDAGLPQKAEAPHQRYGLQAEWADLLPIPAPELIFHQAT
jgi:hypothetical protein